MSLSKTYIRSEKKGRDFWGEPAWTTIHSLAAAYTPDKCDEFKTFVTSFFKLLPCPSCSKHAQANLKILPLEPYLGNNHDLFFWTYVFHDAVNQQCNERNTSENRDKPKKSSPNYDDIKTYYFKALVSECKVCAS